MKFKEWLERSGWTGASLAAALGVTRQSVHLWVQGHTYPKLEHLAHLQRISQGKITAKSFLSSDIIDLMEGGQDGEIDSVASAGGERPKSTRAGQGMADQGSNGGA